LDTHAPKGYAEQLLRSFEVIVFPTEKCNLRCAYCYEDFENGRMSDEIVQGVMKLIGKRLPQVDTLNVAWFGGEPLLETDIIRRVLQHGMDIAPDHLTSSATTNGVFLTRDVFEELHALNLRNYQISLDGTEEYHDKTRGRINGRGSFRAVYDNICSIQRTSHQTTVVLRIHLHADNERSIYDLLEQLHADGLLTDTRFHLAFKPIGDWGGNRVQQMNLLTDFVQNLRLEVSLKERVNELINKGAAPDASVITSARIRDLAQTGYICYAARPNSFAVRSTGRLAKCTVALDSPSNDIGYLTPDGEMFFDEEMHQRWYKGFFSDDQSVLSCPWHATVEPLEKAQRRAVIPLIPIVTKHDSIKSNIA
jgi:uncharacterized protein